MYFFDMVVRKPRVHTTVTFTRPVDKRLNADLGSSEVDDVRMGEGVRDDDDGSCAVFQHHYRWRLFR